MRLFCRVALRLPDLQDPLTGSHSVGPCKRSAAGQDIRHGILDFAGWRLRLTRPTGSTHRLTPRRPVQARRRATVSGPSPTSPGWQSEQRPHQNRQPLRHLLSSNGARRHHVNAVLHHKGQQPGFGQGPLIAAMSAAVSGVFVHGCSPAPAHGTGRDRAPRR